MARRSRKNIIKIEECKNNNHETIYKTGIYARLSIQNSGTGKSDTIENQIDTLKNFVLNKEYFELVDIYCDNGVTGTSFERPEFNRMIEDMKKGKINCIVVKDLSRLGRNFIEAGNYIEKIFPLYNIRFISLYDNIDTLKGDKDSIIIGFKNLINEFYARDISRKITASLKVKQNSGKYLGGRTPYGYKRDLKNKYLLVPDEMTADVVRLIFDMKISGKSKLYIARYLNESGVDSPERYRYKNGIVKSTKNVNSLWKERTIDLILKNPVYIGGIAYGKTEKLNFKQKQRQNILKDNWNFVEYTHKAIIEKHDFFKAAEMLNQNKQKFKNLNNCLTEKSNYYLKGKIICGNCGFKLVRIKEKQETKNDIKYCINYRCPSYKDNKEIACTLKGRVKEKEIDESIYKTLNIINKLLNMNLKKENFIKKIEVFEKRKINLFIAE